MRTALMNSRSGVSSVTALMGTSVPVSISSTVAAPRKTGLNDRAARTGAGSGAGRSMRNGTSFPVESARRRSSSDGRKTSSVAGGSATLTSPGAETSIDSRCCHSLNVAASEWPATKLATSSRAVSRRRQRRSFVFIRPDYDGGKALIEERRHDRNDCHAQKRADAVKLLQFGEVVKKQL